MWEKIDVNVFIRTKNKHYLIKPIIITTLIYIYIIYL